MVCAGTGCESHAIVAAGVMAASNGPLNLASVAIVPVAAGASFCARTGLDTEVFLFGAEADSIGTLFKATARKPGWLVVDSTFAADGKGRIHDEPAGFTRCGFEKRTDAVSFRSEQKNFRV